MNKRDTITYKGYEIETFYDEGCESPNEWGNDEQFLIYDHNQFYVNRDGFSGKIIFDDFINGKKLYKGFYMVPVFAYIHGGVSLSISKDSYPFTCGFDTSFKGFVLIKRMKGCYSRERALEQAEGLIETWNMYLSNEIYGYSSEVGSCWGFYGDSGYKEMIADAKSEIDYAIENKIKEHLRKLKGYIKNKVSLIYRNSCSFA